MDFTNQPITAQSQTVRSTESARKASITNNDVAANPSCPQAIMQFQHGTVTQNADLSLSLEPIAVDGRQLLSDPCENDKYATYIRYNQSEKMKVCLPFISFLILANKILH